MIHKQCHELRDPLTLAARLLLLLLLLVMLLLLLGCRREAGENNSVGRKVSLACLWKHCCLVHGQCVEHLAAAPSLLGGRVGV